MSHQKGRSAFVGIIDGTGPREDLNTLGFATKHPSTEKYDQVMKHGFCKQLERKLGLYADTVRYVRGPHNSGAGLERAVGRIKDGVLNAGAREIVLIGYSRGALGCIQVCEQLKTEAPDRTIAGLVLFDPVDRYASLSFRNDIPRNVERSFRAFRILDEAVYRQYDGTILDTSYTTLNKVEQANPYRPWFSRTAEGIERGPNFKARDHIAKGFLGTHGALGGLGYRWIPGDKACLIELCAAVHSWFAHALGWNVHVNPGWSPDVGLQAQSPAVGGAPRPQLPAHTSKTH
jgi:hypothetical protein